MAVSDEKRRNVEGFLRILYDELAKGWGCFVISEYVNESKESAWFSHSPHFFGLIHAACQDYAILALAKLFDKDKDSITIAYLLNYIQQNIDVFPDEQKDAMLRSLPEHRKILATIEPIVENIRGQRNRSLAHLDKKLVKGWSGVYKLLDFREVRRIFVHLFSLLNFYQKCLGIVFFSMDFSAAVKDDLEYLVGLIEKDF
jgi:hypothetical protein